MSMFSLTEVIGQKHLQNTSGHEESFDGRLHLQLLERSVPSRQDGDDFVSMSDGKSQHHGQATFNTVRSLFRNAATALDLELKHYDDGSVVRRTNENEVSTFCHFVPGRIEVMGKHTDYAGGNSLVCATSGRGMAMVSTFIESNTNDDKSDVGDGMKVTIVSVLPMGMEHHATTTTSAPYQVEGRPVVHHTVHVPNDNDTSRVKKSDGVDWTIYPTAVIDRLNQNFGLYPHSKSSNVSTKSFRGGHIFIAISSNLPPASGLSTSSALVTGLFLVLDKHLGLSTTKAYHEAIGEQDDSGTIYNLSTYLGNVENGRDYVNGSNVLKGTVQGGVGTFGGSEDHAAILMGKRNELRLLSFCPTRPYSTNLPNEIYEKTKGIPVCSEKESIVHLPQDVTFVIAYSGAKAEKAGGIDGNTDASIGYNSASELARRAFEAHLSGGSDSDGLDTTHTLADAIRWERINTSNKSTKARMNSRIKAGALSMEQVNPDAREKYSKALVERFEQFYDESEHLVPAVADAMSKEKFDMLGSIVDVSHRGAVNLLKNQVAETAWLPLWARGMENYLQMEPLQVLTEHQPKQTVSEEDPNRIQALASSCFGAGFGGSCWALVHRHQAEEFARQWKDAYDEEFPTKDSNISTGIMREFFLVDPGPGAFCVI